MDREEQKFPTSNPSKSLSFSISSILNDESKESSAESETEEEESISVSDVQIPIAQKADYANAEFLAGTASALLPGADFSPWMYRPMALPGYLPLQTSFLTSKFAGEN